MASVIVTDTHLSDIADAIRGRNGTSNTYTPAEMAAAITSLPSSAELVYSGTVAANTTSTTAALITVRTISTRLWTADKVVYVKLRDAAGKRNNYFYGSDSFFYNYIAANGATTDLTYCLKNAFSIDSSGLVGQYNGAAAEGSGYGVYACKITAAGAMTFRARYDASLSRTINGTYNVEIYLIDYPAGSPYV